MCYDKWDAKSWRVVEDIQFRSVTLTAIKPAAATDTAHCREMLYRGPFATVTDEAGHRYVRGERFAVTADRYAMLTRPGYGNAFVDLDAQGEPGDGTSEPASGGCCS
jgi:hypothetical protein